MFGNNLKSLIYHVLWYFVIMSMFFASKTRPIIEAFIPDAMTRFLIIGITTVLFSLTFTVLFMRPMGTTMNNVTSNGLLIILNIGVFTAAVLFYMIGKLTIFEAILIGLFLLLQFFVIILVMQVKQRRSDRYDY